MARTFTEKEIDALLAVAATRRGIDKDARTIKPCTFRQSGQLTGEQLAAVNGLHEVFARSLTQSLGAYLRVAFEVRLTSVEQVAYSQFLERIPEVTYMMCFRVGLTNARAAMQVDHSLVFPLVDILLGGTGQCEVLTREVTEIEEQIMEAVAKIMCLELESAWAPLGTKLDLDGRRPPAQMQRLMTPTEKTLCLSFEVKLAETSGHLNLIFPVSVSNTLLRKLSADMSYGRPRPADHATDRMIEKMLDAVFAIELGIPQIQLPVNTVAGLAPQAVCDLGIPVRKPATLLIAGRRSFEASPVRHGRLRAAQLGQKLTRSGEDEKQ